MVHNVNGVHDPRLHPGSVKNELIVCAARDHHIVVLTETGTNCLDGVMDGLRDTHKLVYASQVPSECVGRRGHGIAIIVSNACADLVTVYHVAEDVQCVTVKCDGVMFGLAEPVMLCAAYLPPKGTQSHRELLFKVADELAAATQVSEHLLVCGDFNAHVGGLQEVSDAHAELLAEFPELSSPRTAQCKRHNKQGHLLVDIAAVFKCVLATGRVPGDVGQPTYVGCGRQSRPDHVMMSKCLYRAVQSVMVSGENTPRPFDHCPISVTFGVLCEDGSHIDWSPQPEHVCRPDGCGERRVLRWNPQLAAQYADHIRRDSVMHAQFVGACEQADIEKACFCVSALIEHAASAVGMSKSVSVCATLRQQRAGLAVSRPPWFDAACRARKRELLAAAHAGCAMHAYRFLKQQYRAQTRRSKRAYTRLQRDVVLRRYQLKQPELHAMLRKHKHASQTPLATQAWEQYLSEHFQEQTQGQPPPRQRVPASDMAVPLGRGHPPPATLLRQGAARGWVPEPDEFSVPPLYPIVQHQVQKMNARASPGFDFIAAPFIKHAVVTQPMGGRAVQTNVLLPYLVRLFGLMFEKAQIPAAWKVAKLSPLYKRGPLLSPDSYRMLAVSGTMYRLYANVVRDLVTRWCEASHSIPDTQFGFYPGRSTLHPIFILRHLIHAARPSRLHAAFIDFKQAYDTIPRSHLWQHLKRIRMPSCLLRAITNMYDDDWYVLMDGAKTARVQPSRGVKQGCPLSPLLFALYINDIGHWVTNGVCGAKTGSEGVRVTHLLYADDLCLVANDERQLQLMLDRLSEYAPAKHLVINAAKSEVVHFNTNANSRVPTFRLGSHALACKDSFRYLGMLFTRRLNMSASADHAVQPFMAAVHRVRDFLRSHELLDRPDVALWLGKVYVLPAGMYASQVWGTPFLRQDREFESAVQMCHLNYLKRVLGVKRTAPNWAVLRECGHEPLRFYWFRAAVKLYNSMRGSNSDLLQRVARADCALRARAPGCWTSQLMAALQGLRGGQAYCDAVVRGEPVDLSSFCANLKAQLRSVWADVHGLNPRASSGKLVAYHNWMAVPLPRRLDSVFIPKYLRADLPRHVVRNVSRFRLRAHHLRVEAVHWSSGPITCDRCDCNDVQDELHALFFCRSPRVIQLRQKYACLFERVFRPLQAFSSDPHPYSQLHHQVDNLDMRRFLEQPNRRLPFFLSELMDVFDLAGVGQQAEQSPFG